MPDAVVLDEDTAARRAAAVLARLSAAGAREGDRVALIAGNRAEFVAARAAASAAGPRPGRGSPRLAPKEIAGILAHARPRVVLVDAAHRASARAAAPVIVLDEAEASAGGLPRAQIGATL